MKVDLSQRLSAIDHDFDGASITRAPGDDRIALLHPQTDQYLRCLCAVEPYAQKLEALALHDLTTFYHSIRVARMSIDIAIEELGAPDQVMFLGAGALLHDIGKLRIPKEIIDKPGSLTDAELRAMREHPRHGFHEMMEMKLGPIAEIALGHHEYRHGDPYPRKPEERGRYFDGIRLCGWSEIERFKQIVAACDPVDGLTQERSYKPALSLAEVREIMKKEYSGDPAIRDKAIARIRDL